MHTAMEVEPVEIVGDGRLLERDCTERYLSMLSCIIEPDRSDRAYPMYAPSYLVISNDFCCTTNRIG